MTQRNRKYTCLEKNAVCRQCVLEFRTLVLVYRIFKPTTACMFKYTQEIMPRKLKNENI